MFRLMNFYFNHIFELRYVESDCIAPKPNVYAKLAYMDFSTKFIKLTKEIILILG